MKRITMVTAAVVLVAMMLMVGGCGDDSVSNPIVAAPAVKTIPADNTKDYNPNSPIYMIFNDRMDTIAFRDYFFCIDSTARHALQDSLKWNQRDMMWMHQDSLMYYRRMHERGVRGQFHWNNRGDSCRFVPDTAFMHGRQYYMHFRNSMQNFEGDCIRNMGATMTQDLTYSFRTR